MLTEEIRHEIETEATLCEQRSGACIDALRIVQRHKGWVDDESIGDIAQVC